MIEDLVSKKKQISVTGLGYVGLPLALEFAKKFKVIGFDINAERIDLMKRGVDPSKELNPSDFEGCDIEFTSNFEDLKEAHFHIIGVPTDIDEHKVPNLKPLFKACSNIGKVLKKGDIVIFESTVYPGCTEDDCLPILERESNLKRGIDFKFGYSPERINPGDKERTLTTILKIVSAGDSETLDVISEVYGSIIEGGLFKATSIKVAEAAKVIENTQRDLNISLMNELAIIFDKIGIDTNEVIEAAGSKWNFHKYKPGLVGGHCIGVDPYYLMHKSKQLGVDPQVIAAGRRVNDFMPGFIAKKLVQTLMEKGKNPRECKVLIKGITFKEDVADIRNSKVVELIRELMDYTLNVHVVDTHASPNEVAHEYKLTLVDDISSDYDAVIVAVAHKEYRSLDLDYFKSIMNEGPILFDLKGVYKNVDEEVDIWRL